MQNCQFNGQINRNQKLERGWVLMFCLKAINEKDKSTITIFTLSKKRIKECIAENRLEERYSVKIFEIESPNSLGENWKEDGF